MTQLLFSYALLPSSEFLHNFTTGEGLMWKYCMKPISIVVSNHKCVFMSLKTERLITYTHFKEILLIVIFQPVPTCFFCLKLRADIFRFCFVVANGLFCWYFPLKYALLHYLAFLYQNSKFDWIYLIFKSNWNVWIKSI